MTFRPCSLLSLALAILLSSGTWAQTTSAADPALQSRLDALVEQLERQREELHIPGMALVIVKDDEILLAKGFGVSNVEKETAVTPKTLFAIGSSTKAFTTALIAMEVSAGRMDWDEPITKTLPFFDLDVDSNDDDAFVTLRDLACHRTGFTRMSVLWAGGNASREEVLRVASGAEPWDQFRESFHYNNVMFLAAGQAAAVVAESDYDTLLRERLLEPLGMSSSNTSVVASQQDPRLSLGYRWDDAAEEFVQLPMRELDTIAPAGAINSHVLDMAQWLRLQLGDGVYNGKRLISSEQMGEMHSPQIEIAPSMSYGLGWMLGEWRGRKVVEHGGNIDGFAATVALLPEENLGFVLLTNVSSSVLQGSSLPMIWSAVVGDTDSRDNPGQASDLSANDEALDYDEFTGTYIADYAHFDKAEFVVQLNSAGNLAIDVPGQTLFELLDPDDTGKWFFALTDTIALTFERDQNGTVQSLKMYQGGATFESPREGYEFPLEFDLADAKPLIGRYTDPALRGELEVLVINNRLAVDVPGQMAFRLQAPDDDDIWWFRAVPGLGIQFEQDRDNPAAALTFFERGQFRVCPRVEGEAATLPSTAELRASCSLDEKRKTLSTLGPLRLTGTVRMAQSGIIGRFTWVIDGTERYLATTDMGNFAVVTEAYDRGVGTVRSTIRPFRQLSGDELDQARHSNPLLYFGDWSALCDEFSAKGREDLDGLSVLRVTVQSEGIPETTLLLDEETGHVVKVVGQHVEPSIGATFPYSATFEDFRTVHGLSIPHLITTTDDSTGHVIVAIEDIEVGLTLQPGQFILEE
ncbi:MAG: CubicO group peptidase (beta-lactamase class C family) [Pseudohongiellaceae bacterium]|jgi:CubicO group peptidase (beta-lactamase class C family)